MWADGVNKPVLTLTAPHCSWLETRKQLAEVTLVTHDAKLLVSLYTLSCVALLGGMLEKGAAAAWRLACLLTPS